MTGQLLELLRYHQGQWLGIEALRISLRLEPLQIHRQIDELRRMGHRIESEPVNGFRWQGCELQLNTDLLQCGLRSKRVGNKILVYQNTESTNDVAWQHGTEKGFDGLVVFSESQSGGRGRLGRTWSGGVGCSLLCSILLQKYSGASEQALSLIPGLAIVEAVESYLGVRLKIKWPNDVIANGKKLAGTMVEGRNIANQKMYVLGIGINCLQNSVDFPEELRATAISLNQLAAARVDRVYLAQLFIERLDQWLVALEQGQDSQLHAAWLSHCDMPGRRISVIHNGSEFTGRVVDVAVDRGLILQLDSGLVKVFDAATTSLKL